jgi:hypothetical protein
MQTILIKFPTQEDRVRGFYELATRSRITSFPGEVYQVPYDALRLLDDQQIEYRRATHAEGKTANGQSKRRCDGLPEPP